MSDPEHGSSGAEEDNDNNKNKLTGGCGAFACGLGLSERSLTWPAIMLEVGREHGRPLALTSLFFGFHLRKHRGGDRSYISDLFDK